MSQKENNADFSTHVHSDNELPQRDTSDRHSGNAPKHPSSRLRFGLAMIHDRDKFTIPQPRTPGSFSTPTIPSPNHVDIFEHLSATLEARRKACTCAHSTSPPPLSQMPTPATLSRTSLPIHIPSPQPPQSLPLPRPHPARQISGNHIASASASNATNAPRVRFADEKDMLGVTGRREVARVVDNEWKKGKMTRSAQGSYENDSSG
jgi:hypothetical protein